MNALVAVVLWWLGAPTAAPASAPASLPASKPALRTLDDELLEDADFMEFLLLDEEAPWLLD